ncbi:MAG: hypothetical protein ACFFCS_01955 [Candidatus Hodarchaeota archaeon]
MPKGIFLIEWDELEGAVVNHKYPADLEIDLMDMQKVMMTHQMESESNWIILTEKDFKAVSYLDFELGDALVFSLEQYETGSDFIKVLVEMAGILLPYMNSDEVQEFDKRLEENFKMIKSIISTKEVVLLSFAKQIEELKEEKLDTKDKLKILMNYCEESPKKLLVYLVMNDNATMEEIKAKFTPKGMTKEEIKTILDDFVQKQVIILDPKTNGYSINLSSKLLDDVKEISLN